MHPFDTSTVQQPLQLSGGLKLQVPPQLGICQKPIHDHLPDVDLRVDYGRSQYLSMGPPVLLDHHAVRIIFVPPPLIDTKPQPLLMLGHTRREDAATGAAFDAFEYSLCISFLAANIEEREEHFFLRAVSSHLT
jgi:hypothetical protein